MPCGILLANVKTEMEKVMQLLLVTDFDKPPKNRSFRRYPYHAFWNYREGFSIDGTLIYRNYRIILKDRNTKYHIQQSPVRSYVKGDLEKLFWGQICNRRLGTAIHQMSNLQKPPRPSKECALPYQIPKRSWN